MKVGVTGASGFVGKAVLARLQNSPFKVIPLVRTASGLDNEIILGDLERLTANDFPQLDFLIHLAALTHVVGPETAKSARRFHEVNVVGTQKLLQTAIAAGVHRVFFMSSVKVHGESSQQPFTEADIPKPEDAYGRTKLEAEKLVGLLCTRADVSYTIIRSPLVYGKGVGANFSKLAAIAKMPFPLPLDSIHNARSLIHVDNLADAIVHILISERADGHIFLVSDGEDVSTSNLLRLLAKVQGRINIRLMPSWPVRLILTKLGKEGLLNRLFSSLQVDSRKIRMEFGWTPPRDLTSAMAETFARRRDD